MENGKIDPKRTVKARSVRVFEPDGSAPNGIDAEPGECQHVGGGRIKFACPGCGQWGSVHVSHPKRPETWDLVAGDRDDPATLTLMPSILCKGCCGWHGYLTNGTFTPC